MKFLSNILVKAGLIVEGTTDLQGTATALTPATSDNTTKIATTAFVKAQGYLTGSSQLDWNNVINRPTTLSGYGITDPVVLTSGSYTNPSWIVSLGWSKITGTPTTLSGYGITDPVVLTSGSYTNPSWIVSLAWSKITGTPTSLAGYGITDPVVLTSGSYSNPSWIIDLAWSKITGTPTTLSGYGITDGVPSSRTITINGTSQDLTANRTFNVGTVTNVASLTLGTTGTDLSSSVANGTTTPVITLNVPTASATNRGALSSTDWTTFNNKQNAITLTTTGTSGAATLVGSTLNIPQYQSVLTNPITGTGTTGQVSYFNGTNSITSSPTFAFTPTSQLLVNNSVTAASAIARGINATPTLIAAANNDVLVGLDINPTFTNGAFTGVTNLAIRTLSGRLSFTGAAGNGTLNLFTTNSTFLSNASNGVLTFNRNSSSGWQGIEHQVSGALMAYDAITTSGEFRRFANSGGYFQTFYSNGVEAIRLSTSQNLLIGTTTDAGFRLDVNGTARVQSFTTINAAPAVNSDAALSVNATTNNSTGGQMYGIRSVSTVATNTGNLTGIDATINNSTTAQNMAGFNSAVNVTANTTAQVRGYSVGSAVTGTGIVTNFIGYDFIDVFKSGSGAITRQIAYRIANLTAGSAANIGILFNNAGASTVNGTWDIYSQSGNASYLAGNLLLGTTSDIGGRLQVAGTITATSAIARGINVNNTLVAAANNDVLVGLDINPTFTNGAFTGVSNIGIRYAQGLTVFSNGQAYLGNSSGYHIRTKDGSGNNAINAYNAASANDILYLQNVSTGNLITVTGGGKLLVGTSTDAGFKLDIAGTARVQGNTTITGAVSATANGHRFGNLEILTTGTAGGTGQGIVITGIDQTFQFQGSTSGGVTESFRFTPWVGTTTTQAMNAANKAFVRVYGGFTDGNTNNLSGNQLWLSPTYNFAGTRTGIIVRGIYYNPTLTSLTNTTHRAIETETGDVVFGSTSGNVMIGTTTAGGRFTIQPTNDQVGMAISGSSLTGSNAQSLVSLSQTWNTTGNPTAFLLNITNTASGATADLMDLQVGGASRFEITAAGRARLGAYGSGTITGTATYNLAVDASGNVIEVTGGGGGGIGGSGTTNYLPKFTNSTTLGNSQIFDNGTNVGINTATPSEKLEVSGILRVSSTTSPSVYLNVTAQSGNIIFDARGSSDQIFHTQTLERLRIGLGGDITISTIANATIDTDKFLVSDSGVIKYRTGSEILSDIGGQGALTLTTTGTSGAATLVGNTLNIPQYSGGGGTVSGTTNYIAKFTSSTAVGNSRLFDDGTNVGIDTTSPNYKLQVAGGSAGATAHFTHTGANGGINVHNTNSLAANRDAQIRLVNGSTYFGASDRSYQLVNDGTSTTASDFYIQYWDGTSYNQRFRINSSGSIGIGTNTIGSRLQVNGNAAIGYSASTAAPTNGLAVAGNVGIGLSSPSTQLHIRTATVTGFSADAAYDKIIIENGNSAQGANIQLVSNSTNGVSEIGFSDATRNVGLISYGHSTNNMNFSTSSTTRFTITSGGDIGIGTTTIGSKLQVNGNAAIGYSASTAAPTNGLAVSGNVGVGTNSPSGRLDLSSSSDNYLNILTSGAASAAVLNMFNSVSGGDGAAIGYNIALRFGTVTGVNAAGFTERMRITNGGNVGIGTTTIGSKLQVNGNAAIGYSASTAAPTNGLIVAGNAYFGGQIAALTDVMQLRGTGNVLIAMQSTVNTQFSGMNLYNEAGTLAASFALGNSNTGSFSNNFFLGPRTASGNLLFVTGASGTTRMTMTTNGELQFTPAANTSVLSTTGAYSLTGANAQSLIDLAGTWNTTGNPTAIKLNITNTASGTGADLMELQVGGVNQFLVTKAGAIQTSAPSGGTANTWKLGTVATVTPTSPNRTIEVEVGGTIYYLHAKTTND